MYCTIEWTSAGGCRKKRGRPNVTKKMINEMVRDLEEDGGHNFNIRFTLKGIQVWP